MSLGNAQRRVEFGDFQTPLDLANAVCHLVARRGFIPATVTEPTCGDGAFLAAAIKAFPDAVVRGYECNARHVEAARRRTEAHPLATVTCVDFFKHRWGAALSPLPQPMLVLGNPPWVTNAALGAVGGVNLPAKANVDGLRGIEAVTGGANFDISEWMIRENIRWLANRTGAIAVLCKTSVARKALAHAWSLNAPVKAAAIYSIDSHRYFDVSVDACLLYIAFAPNGRARHCEVYSALDAVAPDSRFGVRDGVLVSDLAAYERLVTLRSDAFGGWRSGIKHDCRRVFEFSLASGRMFNGLGEEPALEPEVLYPLLKSSDVVRGRPPRKHVLVPHRTMAESPLRLQRDAPNAWRYLVSHRQLIGRRASSIYRKRPPFSIFGVGPYSFAPWKVAIAALYKTLRFTKVGPMNGRPVLLDDTCYFMPCQSEEECDTLHEMVSSPVATEFWSSMIFWDSKRPITAKLLNRLDLTRLTEVLGLRDDTLDGQLFARQSFAPDRQLKLIDSAEIVS